MKTRVKAAFTLLFALVLLLSGCAGSGTNEAVLPGSPLPTEAAVTVTPAPTEAAPTASEPALTETPAPVVYFDENGFVRVVHLGEVPQEFSGIVSENFLGGRSCTVSPNGILRRTHVDGGEYGSDLIELTNCYGSILASYENPGSFSHEVQLLTATSDGGFLFLDGFSEYQLEDGSWTSEQGFASYIVKCGGNGEVVFRAEFDGFHGEALSQCIERDGKYYIFGTYEVPETKRIGTYSLTDVYAACLDENGGLLFSRRIGGGDFDTLNNIENSESGMVLYISSQSHDGDFADAAPGDVRTDWLVTLDEGLNITQKEKGSGQSRFDFVGYRAGQPVYRTDPMFDGFNAGTPTFLICYDSLYLVVSSHRIGVMPADPFVSAILYYTETVYTLYGPNGDILFRTAFDDQDMP